MRQELIALVQRFLQKLPEVQRKVLALYYVEDLRLKEIAAVFGLTESRISQIHSAAVLAIRGFIERHEARPPGTFLPMIILLPAPSSSSPLSPAASP
ncbi:MAG: sigma-70 family RNA polymerase sigma factor [Verrucomicrobia bacterium]|nr:sigma-70 family RNA polymerase sigma factor [Verrucomicrobiota bacterium]